jgi:hypothetical protein
MVRKTLSVGTLGVVSFRSKKEKLRRAERELAREQHDREAAEGRVAIAEKRLKHATSQAARSDKKLEKANGKRKKRRAARLGELMSTAEPLVHQTAGTMRDAGREGAKRGRKAARAARKNAKHAREVVSPRAEKLAQTISEKVDDLTSH